MNSNQKRIEGYVAAGVLIERLLDDAQKKSPKRMSRINTNSAAYRAGVYQAALTAHCCMVLGEHPEGNAELIHSTIEKGQR